MMKIQGMMNRIKIISCLSCFLSFLSCPLLFCLFISTAQAENFITGDKFRALADAIYDDRSPEFDPKTLSPRSIVFVKNAYLEDFFKQFHPQIAVSYVLISHNSDEPTPEAYVGFLEEEKLLAWFGVNGDEAAHEKFHAIPIGLANRHLEQGNLKVVESVLRGEKKHLAYMNFTISTFSPERWPLFKQLAWEPFCYRTGKKSFEGYLNDLAASDFSISPRGFGLDTYRLWESLYLGVVPVVKSSCLDALYKGLPILIVDDWKEVTEEFLLQKKEEFRMRSFCLDKLKMRYWTDKIDEVLRD